MKWLNRLKEGDKTPLPFGGSVSTPKDLFSPIIIENIGEMALFHENKPLARTAKTDKRLCEECPSFEVLVVGNVGNEPLPGCVRKMDSGPWGEEWRRLPDALELCSFVKEGKIH